MRLRLKVQQWRRKAGRVLLFWKRGRGAEAFLERYRPEGVLSVGVSQRSRDLESERCQVCSLCTFSCQAIQEGKAPPSFEPKQIAAIFSKCTHETEVFLEEWYPCAGCNACTVWCPNEVPIHAMVDQILNRRSQLGFRRGTQRDRM